MVQLQNAAGKVWQVLQGNMKMVAVRRHDLPEPDIFIIQKNPITKQAGVHMREGAAGARCRRKSKQC